MMVGSWNFGSLAVSAFHSLVGFSRPQKIVPIKAWSRQPNTTVGFFLLFLGGFCLLVQKFWRNQVGYQVQPMTSHMKTEMNIDTESENGPLEAEITFGKKRQNRFHVSFHDCNISLPLATGNTTCQVLGFLPDF